MLKPKRDIPVHRMVFHEITAPAIREAFANPRELNMRLVNAQETRRLLDRLYGYDVSEVAWKKVNPGLSAGRVQSVATRLVVEREREIMAFVPAGWWDLQGTFAAAAPEAERTAFGAKLVAVDGTRARHRQRLLPAGRAHPRRPRRARRGRRHGARRRAGRRRLRGPVRRGQALPQAALRPVHHLEPPAGRPAGR